MAATVLASQAAVLRSLQTELLDSDNAQLEVLRAELARCIEQERSLSSQLAAARRQSAAKAAESDELRTQLERQSKRAAWELRKVSEAAAAASATAATAAISAEEKLRAEVARQSVQLQKQEVELKTVHGKVKALRHRLDEQALHRGQAAFLDQLSQPALKSMNGSELAPEAECSSSEAAEDVMATKDTLGPLQDAFIARVLGY